MKLEISPETHTSPRWRSRMSTSRARGDSREQRLQGSIARWIKSEYGADVNARRGQEAQSIFLGLTGGSVHRCSCRLDVAQRMNACGSQIGDRTHVVAPQRIVSRIDDAIIIAIVGGEGYEAADDWAAIAAAELSTGSKSLNGSAGRSR